MQSEIKQTEKDKYSTISLKHGIWKSQLIEIESEVVVTQGSGKGKWEDIGQRV